MKTAPHLGQQVQGQPKRKESVVADTTRPARSPEMEEWLERQLARFTTDQIEAIARQVRGFERANQTRASRGVAA